MHGKITIDRKLSRKEHHMSDTPKKPGPVPQFEPYPALLRPDQIAEIRSAGARQGNAFLRNLIDFGIAHRPLFLTWIATRGEIATEGQKR
jgi:hypothetical protein